MTRKEFFHHAVLSITESMYDKWSDNDIITHATYLTEKVGKVEPFDNEPTAPVKPISNTAEIFQGFVFPKQGAMRKDIEAWIKRRTKYTSNRAMQTIINDALENHIIKRNLKTRKYHPSTAFPTAEP